MECKHRAKDGKAAARCKPMDQGTMDALLLIKECFAAVSKDMKDIGDRVKEIEGRLRDFETTVAKNTSASRYSGVGDSIFYKKRGGMEQGRILGKVDWASKQNPWT